MDDVATCPCAADDTLSQVQRLPLVKTILDGILHSGRIDMDGFRMSLWSGFYTNGGFAEVERSFGLMRDENNILFCLAFYGQLTAKSISEVLGRPKNSISRSVDQLLRKNLISGARIETDRRHIMLTIEPVGRELVEATTDRFRQRQERMLRCLSPVERVALDHLLAKLMDDSQNWLIGE